MISYAKIIQLVKIENDLIRCFVKCKKRENNGFANKLLFLRLGAQFQEHGRQHADALTAESGVHLGRAEFFGNDPGADDVGFGAIAAVSLRDGAAVVAIGDQFGLPGSHGRTTRAIAGLGLLVNIGGDKGFDLCAKGVVLGTIREIHF